jgi:ATP-binding cassette, subfamily A (ABC1), member 3
MAAEPQDYEILAKGLRKVYIIDGPKKHKVAVDNLSFGIKRGEVFGLLGINGAGKTTTFKMLAGEVTSTAGDSYFKGMKISENIDKVREDLGYCPQFDALIENLTVYEQLELFYDLKSLSGQRREAAIANKL